MQNMVNIPAGKKVINITHEVKTETQCDSKALFFKLHIKRNELMTHLCFVRIRDPGRRDAFCGISSKKKLVLH